MATTSNQVDGEGCPQHTIKVYEVNQDQLEAMHRKISQDPKLLSKAAGKSSCCIFRVPQSFVEINGTSYQPHIVSIGPYHRGNPQFQMIEEHKWRYLASLLSRTKNIGLNLEDYMKAVEPHVPSARECYSEEIHLSTDEFIEMMVVDGCFIVELFRKVKRVVKFEPGDPLVTMSWIFPFFYRDFLRLENQIPYFILECLYDLTHIPGQETKHTFAELAFEFFNNVMLRPEDVLQKFHNHQGKHLLDLIKRSYIPEEDPLLKPSKISVPSHVIHCVSKLRRAGIKLAQSHHESVLVVKFENGMLQMPKITIDDFMSSFLLNCVAYEQCHHSSSKHITTYATLLDCLVNTHRDVEYLCDKNIIENYFGTDAEVAKFINNMGKDVAFDIERCYLAELFNDVHKYYGNRLHVQWASFKYTYFDTPWSFISALAALVLLLLTVGQTFYTIFAYYRPS